MNNDFEGRILRFIIMNCGHGRLEVSCQCLHYGRVFLPTPCTPAFLLGEGLSVHYLFFWIGLEHI